eukprot:scaffold425174_cov19-Prasinocladus_malaysianus.AAC.1
MLQQLSGPDSTMWAPAETTLWNLPTAVIEFVCQGQLLSDNILYVGAPAKDVTLCHDKCKIGETSDILIVEDCSQQTLDVCVRTVQMQWNAEGLEMSRNV